MKILLILCSLFLISFILMACVSQAKNEGQILTINGVSYFAQQSFDTDFELSWNEMKSHCIISKSIDTNNGLPYKTIFFEVYESASDTIVYKDKIIRSQMSWISDTQIKVSQLPGRPSGSGGKIKKYTLTLPDFKKSLLK